MAEGEAMTGLISHAVFARVTKFFHRTDPTLNLRPKGKSRCIQSRATFRILFSTGLPPCSSGRQSCFLDQVASPVQFANLSIEVSYRVGDARKAPQKSTHFETPILTLQLRGTMAPSVGHRGALKVQIRPLQ